MVYYAIRLGYHPVELKRARRILFEKGGKRDFILLRFYRVIRLFNYIDKVVEKVIAYKLFFYCENYSQLHSGQMGGRKERLAIDTVTTLVHTVYEKWEQKKLATVLFINVNRTFDHILKEQLLNEIIEHDIDGDLVN